MSKIFWNTKSLVSIFRSLNCPSLDGELLTTSVNVSLPRGSVRVDPTLSSFPVTLIGRTPKYEVLKTRFGLSARQLIDRGLQSCRLPHHLGSRTRIGSQEYKMSRASNTDAPMMPTLVLFWKTIPPWHAQGWTETSVLQAGRAGVGAANAVRESDRLKNRKYCRNIVTFTTTKQAMNWTPEVDQRKSPSCVSFVLGKSSACHLILRSQLLIWGTDVVSLVSCASSHGALTDER